MPDKTFVISGPTVIYLHLFGATRPFIFKFERKNKYQDSLISAFVIANISIKNINKWEKYASQAPDTIKSHSGEIIFKGKAVDILAGNHGFDICVTIKFASRATADCWYMSEEYQELRNIRDESASVNMVMYTDN